MSSPVVRAAKAARPAFAWSCAFALAACASDEDATRALRSAIVGGTASTATEDAIVLLVHVDPANPDEPEQCTGTLLAPNLVLTARHCVSDADTRASCNEEGKSDFGGQVSRDYPARELMVFAGAKRPRALDEGVFGKEVLTTGASTICDHDIALVLLERDVQDARIAPVRLGPPSVGESLTLVGWGLTSDGTLPANRQSRAGVSVRAVGPLPRLGPKEFRVGQGSCAGDSGGPALAATGAVLGVLSRGGTGASADASLVEVCETGENVYTQVGAHEELLTEGYARAGHPMWREGEPDPTPPPAAGEEAGGCTASPARLRARGGLESLFVAALVLASVRLFRRRSAA